MMMNDNFPQELYLKLQSDLTAEISGDEDLVLSCKACLKLIKVAIQELKEYYEAAHLKAAEKQVLEEMVWPKFNGLGFYYKELIWIEYNKPIGNNYEMIGFYKQEIEFIRYFFARHAGQYQLHKIKMMELEEDDLLPGHQLNWVSFLPDCLPFSDEYSIAARFIGYEHLLKEALGRLQKHEELEQSAPRDKFGRKMQWTGKVTNLVELAYGLHETGQINNGQATISEIMGWLKQSFQVRVKSPYKIYDIIRSRKRLSPVNFLEQMRLAVYNRMETEMGYVPGSY